MEVSYAYFFIRFSELGGTFEPKPQHCWVSNELENLDKI